MTKVKNKRIYSTDHAWLQMLADELRWAGRFYTLDLKNDCLTQLVYPPRKVKEKKERRPRRES